MAPIRHSSAQLIQNSEFRILNSFQAMSSRGTNVFKSAVRVVRNLRTITREFDDPLRSLLLGMAANGCDLDLKRLQLLKPFDAPFRNQCLALLLGVPGFNVEKAVELLPLDEPLRTQALTLLASTPDLDVQSVFAVYRFDEPFRSQCIAWLMRDPTLDVAKLRLLQPCQEPVRQQALAVIAGLPALDVDAVRLEIFTRHRPEVPGHADVFFRDILGVTERVQDDEVHMRAALDWLLCSQAITGTGGFAAAYSFKDGWLPPYPETTGYIIPTLFDAHAVLGDARLCKAAVAAAGWELEIQLPSGAIQSGYWGADPQRFWTEDPVPAAFNTGQVVLGWNRAFQETGDARFLDASVRACRFLVDCIDEAGIFRRGLSPGPTNPTRAYYTRVACAMAWTARLTGEARFETAARRHLDWVLGQQQPDGWFLHAGFQDDDTPLTHTMAYTAEGLLDAGELLDDERYVDASRRHVMAAAQACEQRGFFLPARYTSGWKSTDPYCCVPGNAQFATLWCRHGRRAGDLPLVNTGLKMVDWLKQRQPLDNVEPGIRGGLSGAWPIDGGYSVFTYVNWGAKFFVDALIEAGVARRYLAADA
jgi:hypothetical protein